MPVAREGPGRRHPPEHRTVLFRQAPLQRERRRRASRTRLQPGSRSIPAPLALRISALGSPAAPCPPVHTQPSAGQPPSSPAQTSIASVTLWEEAAQARAARPRARPPPAPFCRPALTRRRRRVRSSRRIGPSRLGADETAPPVPPWPRRKGRWKGWAEGGRRGGSAVSCRGPAVPPW